MTLPDPGNLFTGVAQGNYDIDRVAPDVPENAGLWNAPLIHNAPDVKDMLTQVREKATEETRERAAILFQAIQLVCKKLGKEVPKNVNDLNRAPTSKLVREMRKHLEELSQDNQMAANLLGLLRGEFRNVPRLPEAIHKLEKLGLASIEAVPFFSATPSKGGARKKS